MKKIYYILTLFTAMSALWACTPEVDDIFEGSASERSSKDIENVRKILMDAPNGWRLEYFGDLNYGGYTVMMDFTEDSVKVGSEQVYYIADSHKYSSHNAGLDANGKCITETSHYKLEQSMGTVLSLDEYNDVFHYFSMPNNPDQWGTKDEGFRGDFEFRIISASPDSIIMRGKKHSNRIRMYPIEADRTWEQVLKDIEDTQAFMDSRNYTLDGEDYKDTVIAYKQYHTIIFQYRDSLGELATVTAPFVTTKEGYRFYSTIDVKGVSIDGILKGDTQERYLLSNNSAMWLNSYMPTLAEYLYTGSWYVTYANMGSYTTDKWDKFLAGLAKKRKKSTQEKWRIEYARFGYFGPKQFGLNIQMNNVKEIQAYGTYTVLNDAQDEIKFVWTTNGADAADFEKDGANEAREPFFGKFGRSFKLTTDNQRSPSFILMTDIDEPNNWIKLTDTYQPFKPE